MVETIDPERKRDAQRRLAASRRKAREENGEHVKRLRYAEDAALSPWELKFVDLLFGQCNGNRMEAVQLAGFPGQSNNASALAKRAAKLLKKPTVINSLRARSERKAKKLEVNAESIAEEYRKIASAHVGQVFEWDERGEIQIRSSLDIPRDVLVAIESITHRITKEGTRTITVKFHSKTDALKALGQHLGMFVEKVEHKVDGADVHFYLPDNGRGVKRDGAGESNTTKG